MHRKLFLVFGTIILVGTLLIGIVLSLFTYNQVLNNSKHTYNLVFEQYSSHLSSIIETSQSHLLTLSVNNELQDFLRDFNVELTDVNETANYLNSIYYSGMLERPSQKGFFDAFGSRAGRIGYSAIIYGLNDSMYYRIESPFISTYTSNQYIHNLDSVKQAGQNPGEFVVQIDTMGQGDLTIYKAVYDTKDWKTVLGVIAIQISSEDIKSTMISKLKTNYNINAFIVEQFNEEIRLMQPTNMTNLKSILKSNVNYYVEDNSYYMRNKINSNDIYLVGSVPVNYLVNPFLNIINLPLLIILCIPIFAVLVASIYFSKKFATPIVNLSQTMTQVRGGVLDAKVETKEGGEIKQLYDSFNYMIDVINDLIEKNYINQIKQKQTELTALQAQINTHFLYNTLDTVNFLAREYNAEDISLIVTSLASLLRISLSKGEDVITIEDEVKHVLSYLEIQKIRYSNSITTKIYVDESINYNHTIKMLLQPLVENAIYHGIEKNMGCGEIIIEITKEGDYIHEKVKNTGGNLNIQLISNLISSPYNGADNQHYGVKNIQARLSLRYKNNFKYYYEIEDKYTVANIIFPINYKKKANDYSEVET